MARQSLFMLVGLVAGASAPVGAVPINLTFTNTYTSSVTAVNIDPRLPGAGIAIEQETGALFPAALGELRNVELTFDGRVTFTALGGQNYWLPPRLPVPIVTPYTVYPALEVRIRGLTDLYDLQPFVVRSAPMHFSGVGGDTAAAIGVYSFRFSYFDLFDAFVGPQNVTASPAFTAPSALAAQLDDFRSDLALSNALLLTYNLSFLATQDGPLMTPTLVGATSLLQVTTRYEFEPAIDNPSGPPAAVSAPGSALLLLTGLAIAGTARRMR
jgi:hypothetical protein